MFLVRLQYFQPPPDMYDVAFGDSTHMFWVNLKLVKEVQQGFLGTTELSVSRQPREELVLRVTHLLCYTLRKSLYSFGQEIVRCFQGDHMLCKTQNKSDNIELQSGKFRLRWF